MIFSSKSKKILAGMGIMMLSLTVVTGAEARRSHTDDTVTKSVVEDATKIGKTIAVDRYAEKAAPLNDRIAAILNPPVAEPEAMTVPFDVPTTVSAYDNSIMGTPLASQEQCVNYLLSVNPNPNIAVSPRELVSYYYEEGTREGIRPDVAFAQALKETGYFRYGGTVTPDQNNYCGLGTTSSQVKGAYFSSPQLGVRAQIQHLLAYASTRMPSTSVVDPRYSLVRSSYGTRTLTRWEDLNGRWAVPGYTYGEGIMSIFRAMLTK